MTFKTGPKLHRFGMKVPAKSPEAFEAWRWALSPMYTLDALVSSERTTYVADIESYSLGIVQCGISSASSSHFERSRSVLGHSLMDSLNIIIYTQGSYQMTLNGQDVFVSAGDIVLHDMTREMSIKADNFTNISYIFPRYLLEPLMPNLDELHGFVLRKGTPLHAILYSHLIELKAQLPHLTQEQVPMINEVTASLVAACIGQPGQGHPTTHMSVSVATLQRIRRVIDENLANADLGPEFLTQKCGVSRASLYRQFEALGGVAKFIQERRLARVYQDLANPSYAHERINTVSERWGFTNAAVLTRAFRRQYDMKPSELRAQFMRPNATAARQEDNSQGFALLQRWLTTSVRL